MLSYLERNLSKLSLVLFFFRLSFGFDVSNKAVVQQMKDFLEMLKMADRDLNRFIKELEK